MPPSRGKIASIRFSRAEWDLIAQEAQLDGVPASQFIRTAAIGRAAFRWADRMPPGDQMAELARVVGPMLEARHGVDVRGGGITSSRSGKPPRRSGPSTREPDSG